MRAKLGGLILVSAMVGAALSLAGCGGGSAALPPPPSPAITVTITPQSAVINQGATQTFTASVTGMTNTAVTWSVREVPGGSITSSGVYTAPSTAGTFHVVATSQADSTKSATAAITVPLVSVAISPPAAMVAQDATALFTATVSGTVINTSVTWSLQEGTVGGSITSAGVYTAPQVAGTFHVVATSQADPTKSAMSNVIVPSIAVLVSPTSDTLGPTGSRAFKASVSGSINTGLNWSVEEGAAGGSITSGGVYTAPTTMGLFHVVATSAADPGATAVAIVTVAPSGFTATSDMGTSRVGTATLLPNGTVLLAGGNSGSPLTNQTAEIFDPATNTFSPTGTLVSPRNAHTATLLQNGKVLIAGGISSPSSSANTLATAELYDGATETFTATGNMAVPRRDHTATLLTNGKVLVAGGVDGNNNFLSSAEIYDPATGTFTSTGNLITGRVNHAAVLLSSGKVLIAGGCCDSNSRTEFVEFASAELYDPGAGTFGPTGFMGEAREMFAMTLLPDGRVLAAGGLIEETADACASNADPNAPCGGSFNNADLYDPSSGTFTETGAMVDARSGHTATLLPSGSVLVAGGQDGSGSSLYTAELFDPATGTFAFTGSMETQRDGHTATLLNDRRVLVTGGRNCTIDPLTGNQTCVNLASAEIYK